MTFSELRQKPYFSYLMGGVIYASGDAIASLIAGEFDLIRLFGVFGIGASLYGFEIQRYFRWIEKRLAHLEGKTKVVLKTFMALIYFNPLWIARHLALVFLVSGKAELISWGILETGFLAFAVNIPVSILANYIIQNRVPLNLRFFSSAVFSGLMAIYYSMSTLWF
jgi:hypothetical protein